MPLGLKMSQEVLDNLVGILTLMLIACFLHTQVGLLPQEASVMAMERHRPFCLALPFLSFPFLSSPLLSSPLLSSPLLSSPLLSFPFLFYTTQGMLFGAADRACALCCMHGRSDQTPTGMLENASLCSNH